MHIRITENCSTYYFLFTAGINRHCLCGIATVDVVLDKL